MQDLLKVNEVKTADTCSRGHLIKITLLDVVRAIEGPLLEFAGEPSGESGERAQSCWDRVFDALSENLSEIRLTDMVKAETDAEPMWHI